MRSDTVSSKAKNNALSIPSNMNCKTEELISKEETRESLYKKLSIKHTINAGKNFNENFAKGFIFVPMTFFKLKFFKKKLKF